MTFPISSSSVTGIAVTHEPLAQGLGRLANVEHFAIAGEGIEGIRNGGQVTPMRVRIAHMLEFLPVHPPLRRILHSDMK